MHVRIPPVCAIIPAGGMRLFAEEKRVLLEDYPIRKTRAQKRAFIEHVKAFARARGLAVSVEEGGRFVRSRNIILGNPARAKVLITAHYDTCAWLPFPNFMTPGNWKAVILGESLLLAVLAALGVCGGGAVRDLLSGARCPQWIAGAAGVGAGVLVSLGLLALMLVGPANPSNANDNTSGVLLLLAAADKLKERADVAFVLFDNEEKGLLGASAFAAAHPQFARRLPVVNMDCIGDGGTLLYTGVKNAMAHPLARRILAAMEETAPEHGLCTVSGAFPRWLYPSDQMIFPRGTAFAALKGKKLLYLDRIHTAGDTRLDDRNLLCLLDILEKSL